MKATSLGENVWSGRSKKKKKKSKKFYFQKKRENEDRMERGAIVCI